MPTLIVLDASFSMSVTALKEPEETKLSLALQGLKKFLAHISLYNKLELLSLAAFSSSFDVVFPFSRDYDGIKRHLETIEACDVSCIPEALSRLQSYIFHEWGHTGNCQVIFITDGSLGFGRNSLIAKLASNQFSFNESFCLIPILLIDPSEVIYATSIRTYNRIVELAGQGTVFSPNGDLTIDTVMSMFHRICEVYYTPFTGTITCGCLSETISLCPSPQAEVLSSDTGGRCLQMSSNLKVIGFVQLADLGNPPLLSRHLIVPRPETGSSGVTGEPLKSEATTDEDSPIDEGKIPSFCVLLHASLKVENMAAFCQVADDWFGVIFSWADSKKKSNLMLGILEPGSKSVSWYGDMNLLGPLSDFPSLENPPFPVRPSEKRSYATNVVTWSRPGSLQADVQKVVRHARKLPEKTHNFYKELNKLRKAALTLGFHELLDSLASLLEREGQILRGSAHPEASLQLGHAIQQLKISTGKDPRHASIVPLRTSYGNE